jgi:hypothetical protein
MRQGACPDARPCRSVTQPDRLDAAIENLLGHTTEVVEGLLVAGEEERNAWLSVKSRYGPWAFTQT